MKEQKVYKIRHKVTGLFFKSARLNMSHLSKTGTIFSKKPNKLQMGDHLYCCIEDRGDVYAKPEDWELVTYRIVEE